ncbi:MAG: hypothetical protein K2J80_04550 [Oscillospiraceae bacterium]|nr:hypothetical protein [Oscillospiraceae bacterium]
MLCRGAFYVYQMLCAASVIDAANFPISGAAFSPNFSTNRTIADPTITPSASCNIFFAYSGVEMPKFIAADLNKPSPKS